MLHRFAPHMLVVFPTRPSSLHMPLSGLFFCLIFGIAGGALFLLDEIFIQRLVIGTS